MFVFTAKIAKKRVAIYLLLLVVIAAALSLIIFGGSGASLEATAINAVVKNNEERVEYLTSLGWEVSSEPIEEQTIVIPRDFTGVYSDYIELQNDQGFNLKSFKGLEAVRYTYQILNYPGNVDNVIADIIVYRNMVIAGDVQSTALDGFMHGLSLPNK